MKYILLIFLLLPLQSYADNYLCVAEKATGFYYDTKSAQRKSANFNVEDSKYIITKSSYSGYKIEVKTLGSKDIVTRCKDDFSEQGFLFCDWGGVFFRFNNKNNRYIKSIINGYHTVVPSVNNTKETDTTPYIEIGKCSSL